MDIRPSKISSKSSFQNLGLLGLITAALTVLSVIYLLSHQATAFSRNKETHPKISVSALIDKNNTILARKSLSALNFDTFTPITSVPNFGYTPHPVWLKLTVDNPKGEPLVLKINNPLLDSIRVYQQSPQDQRWSLTHHLGSKRTKNIAHRFFHIDLSTSLINKQTTILLRIQSRDNMLVAPLAILNQASLIEDTNTESITNGLYYGIVAIMLIYNLLLWLFLRERVYLLYSFFISTFALLQLSSDGYLLLWITHNFGNWKTWFNAFAADLSAVAMLVYARAFLDIRKYGPIWDQLAISLATIAVIAAIMVPLGRYEIMLNIASLINAASAPLLIGMGITAYRQGYTPARFFIVGYSFLLITIIFVSYTMMVGNINTRSRFKPK